MGECSAGLFDLIEIDLARLRQIRSALSEKGNDGLQGVDLYGLALVSARMLLITRGVEAASDAEVFDKFATLFINEKLIDACFLSVIQKARLGNPGNLVTLRDDVVALSNAVEELYQNMDDSLQFKTGINEHPAPSKAEQKSLPDLVKDFRGVACPMNFVKTKMALAGLKSGQVLEISLDDGAPIDNVPRSVEQEGHQIVEQKKQGDHWVVIIKKGS
jgi:sulfite reductase (ferredoxin)